MNCKKYFEVFNQIKNGELKNVEVCRLNLELSWAT